MEVPANQTRLAPRELKLLDLDDDVLIMIIEKLDHESKKQMMATCKRFDELIGNTHQFDKNFKFRYNQKNFLERKETRYLEMIRRMFATVEIWSGQRKYDYQSKVNQHLEPPIQKFLEKIGAHILKIKLDSLRFNT
jgi:glycyl-tRNA synthetase beta subunit